MDNYGVPEEVMRGATARDDVSGVPQADEADGLQPGSVQAPLHQLRGGV